MSSYSDSVAFWLCVVLFNFVVVYFPFVVMFMETFISVLFQFRFGVHLGQFVRIFLFTV